MTTELKQIELKRTVVYTTPKVGLQMTTKPIPKAEFTLAFFTRKGNVHAVIRCTETGNTLLKMSSGHVGLTGRRRKMPFAGQRLATAIAKEAVQLGYNPVHVTLAYFGKRRQGVVKGLRAVPELRVAGLEDVTPIPHNGCRPKKRRRL